MPQTPDMDPNDPNPILLITTVDIGEGRTDRIMFRKYDDALTVAQEFIAKHRLPNGIAQPLAQHLLDNLDSNMAEVHQAAQAELANNAAAAAAAASGQQQQHDGEWHESDDEEEEQRRQLQQQAAAERELRRPTQDEIDRKLMDPGMVAALQQGRRSTASTRSAAARSSAGGAQLAAQQVVSDAAERAAASAHERLHSAAAERERKLQARKKQLQESEAAEIEAGRTAMSYISHIMMRDRNSGPFSNYGEMLYAEALQEQAARAAKAQAIHAEEAARELDGVTFHPKISTLAERLYGEREVPAWQRLARGKHSSRTQERLEMLRKEAEAAELAECKFKPRVDKNSAAMMADRCEALKTLTVKPYEQLYQDALRRMQKVNEYENWVPEEATFAPKINKPYTGSAGRDVYSSAADKELRTDVVDRLYAEHRRSQARLEDLRAQVAAPVDPRSGKPLYKPATGRAPAHMSRSKGDASVFDYLYARAQHYAERKEALVAAEERSKEAAARVEVRNSVTVKLFNALKQRRFAQVFEYLDEHGDGVINLPQLFASGNPRLNDLEDEVLEDVESAKGLLIKRVAAGLAEPGAAVEDQDEMLLAACKLSAAQFGELMEEVVTRVKRGVRSYLVPSPTNKYTPDYNFQPHINPRSRAMAERVRTSQVPFYEVLYHANDAKEAEVERARQERELEVMQACTFKPEITTMARNMERGRALRLAAQPPQPRRASNDKQNVRDTADDRAHGGAFSSLTPKPQRAATAAPRNLRKSYEDLEDAVRQLLAKDAALSGQASKVSGLSGGGPAAPAANSKTLAEAAAEAPSLFKSPQVKSPGVAGLTPTSHFSVAAAAQRRSPLAAPASEGKSVMERLAEAMVDWDHNSEPVPTY